MFKHLIRLILAALSQPAPFSGRMTVNAGDYINIYISVQCRTTQSPPSPLSCGHRVIRCDLGFAHTIKHSLQELFVASHGIFR